MAGIIPELYGISPFLCAWVTSAKGAAVCGLIGQGTTRSIAAEWDAPLTDTNLGSQPELQKTAAVLQTLGGMTSITTFSTTQIWNGNKPLKFNLVLEFFAKNDAVSQVMDALQMLEEFASPQVNAKSPVDFKRVFTGDISGSAGRAPGSVSIDLGRKMIYANCVIESVNIGVDKEKDKSGNLIRAQATLDVQTQTMLNASDIAGTWRGK